MKVDCRIKHGFADRRRRHPSSSSNSVLLAAILWEMINQYCPPGAAFLLHPRPHLCLGVTVPHRHLALVKVPELNSARSPCLQPGCFLASFIEISSASAGRMDVYCGVGRARA